ncbi:hypothetical protein D9M71_701350 [compost metagenome]
MDHDGDEIITRQPQHTQMVQHERIQDLARGSAVSDIRQHRVLAAPRGDHPLFDDGEEQVILALEMVEGRATLHADGMRDVPRGGRVKALLAKLARRRHDQGIAGVAIACLGLTRPATPALDRGCLFGGDAVDLGCRVAFHAA